MTPESKQIKYVGGYKYQLREDAHFWTNIHPKEDIYTDLVSLTRNGLLTVRKYFSWDGVTNPAIDTDSNMRAGLSHDAIYYLLRIGKLSQCWKDEADYQLKRIMLEDGAWCFRAKYYEWAVKHFGKKAATEKRKILVSPKHIRKG